MHRLLALLASAVTALALTAASAAAAPSGGEPARTAPATTPTDGAATTVMAQSRPRARRIVGTVVRFSRTRGSPGSDPEDGDLIYYVPWGNLGFYCNTAGIGYSDDTINLGTYDATRDQLAQLEGGDVDVRRAGP